jgi:hypothetical protein
VFASQTEAKRFLIDRIAAQARAEGAALSDEEHWMLGFSESDPEFSVDVARIRQFEAETSEEQFERKISGLLRRCYEREAESNADVKLLYQIAYRRLQQGDHYLWVMVDRALGDELHSGGSSALKSLRAVGLFLLLVLPASFASLMALGLVFTLINEPAKSAGENVPILLGVLFLAGLAYYLIRLWRRESRRNVAA